ncbi:hypothetical protein D021_0312 [Vibrio parahaemolyticus 10296]|nr:hypothetical protein D021_0312 [Vibrio parahaemolyticus 10296]
MSGANHPQSVFVFANKVHTRNAKFILVFNDVSGGGLVIKLCVELEHPIEILLFNPT